MTLEGLLYAIGQIGINDKLINFAAAGGSIYEINDLTVRDYPILYVSPTGTHRMSENYTTYQVTIFFIDRLLEDNSNGVAIHSTAVEVLKNIIKKIAVLEGVAGISDEYTIQLFTETEKMKDRCNGAYATIEIMLLNESTCIMPDEGEPSESGDTPTENWYLYFNNPDGETIPAESTAYTVEWRTNIPDIPYIIYGPDGVIESGSTDGEIRKEVDFAENESTATTREYTFMFLKDNGDNLSGLTWYQAAVEVQPEPEPEPGPDPEPPTPDTGGTDYYFNFTVSDNQVIPADATGFTVSWRTNIPWVSYVFDTPTGITTGSLNSGVTDIYLTFPANTSIEDTPEYSFNAFESSQGNLGSINWKQEEADAYFEFITQDGAVVSSAATSYHVDWDTNYPALLYELVGDTNEFSEVGYVSGSGHTFTFPASMVGSTTRFTLKVKESNGLTELGTLTWMQEANSEIPHDYSGDYLTFEILSGGTIQCQQGEGMFYSLDNGQSWHYCGSDRPPAFVEVEAGDKMLFTTFEPRWSGFHIPRFEGSTAVFNVYGNLDSLIKGLSYGKVFPDAWGIFANTNVVSAENLVMKEWATAKYMFAGCTMLVTAPKSLPVLKGSDAWYRQTFNGCTSLVNAPALPSATTVVSHAYQGMFGGCTSLVNAPALPATTLNTYCYCRMFEGCTSLVNAPDLPATTLAEYCYANMFSGCTSLTTAPELPATTLVSNCYNSMFRDCTSLTTSPDLLAATLEEKCYYAMFRGCTLLNRVKCMASNNVNQDNTFVWLRYASPTGTFIKKAGVQWASNYNGIPSGWTVQEI